MHTTEAPSILRVYSTHVRDQWFPVNTVAEWAGCAQEARVRAEANIFAGVR